MKDLLSEYRSIEMKTSEDIIDFHYQFEIIHPFQDSANNIVPFIIDENLKLFYCRGSREWTHIKEYLLDTCHTAQDNYKAILRYFEIAFD